MSLNPICVPLAFLPEVSSPPAPSWRLHGPSGKRAGKVQTWGRWAQLEGAKDNKLEVSLAERGIVSGFGFDSM